MSACPVITKRNNGNGQASSAAGTFVGYTQTNAVAANVVGTSYQNVYYNPTAKTGDVNFKWSSSTTVTNLPVITRVWLTANGATSATLSAIVFGPPPPPSVVGQDYYVGYSFYGQNMPASGKVTLEFTDPQTSRPAFTCTYDLKSNTTTTAPTIDCSPSITTQPISQSLCGASTASFTVAGTGVNSIQWQVNNSGTWTDISNTGDYSGATTTILTISNPNTYNGKSYRAVLTGSTGCGSTTSNAVSLIARPKPTAVFSTGTNLCGTGTRSLGVNLGGTGPWALTYSTTPSGGSTTTTTISNISSSPFYFSVNPSVNTTYAITAVSDAYCSETSPSGVVSTTVSNAPTITPSNATTCYGNNSFNLTYSATGSPDKYTLTAGVRAMPGFTTLSSQTLSGSPASITIPTSGVVAGVYDFNIVVTNSTTGCSSSSTAFTVTVAALPTVSATAGSGNVCNGSNITLTAAPSGLSSYSWATTTAPATVIATGVSPSVTVNANTTYTVTGSDANGCSASANVTVTTVAGPTLSISPSSPTICSGNATTLTASGGNTYSWTPSTGLSATTGASVVASPTATTTYTVTSQNITGCQSSGTVTVTVNTPAITATADATICSGTIKTLTASGGSTYNWYPATGLYTDASATTAYILGANAATVYAKPTSSTTYYVKGTDVNSCSGTVSSTVSISAAPVDASTSTANTLIFCTQGTTSFPLTVNTTSSVSSMTWSYSTDGVTYTSVTSATTITGVTLTPSSTGNTNTTLTLSAYGNSGYTGARYFRVTIVGSSCTYYYDIFITDTKKISATPAPVASSSTICSGNSTTLTIGNLASGSTVQWQSSSNNSTWSAITSATSASYTASPTANTYYRVLYNGGSGNCGSTTASTLITVDPALASNTISSTTTCTDGTSTVTLSGSAITNGVFQWQSSTTSSTGVFTDILGATSQNYTLPTNILSTTTWYRRIASTSSCSSSTSSVLAVYPPVSNNQITNTTTAYCTTASATTLNGTSPAGGNGTYTYQWQYSTDGNTFNNVPSGGTSQNYTTSAQTSSYWYKRTVQSVTGACTTTSGSFKITVNTPPTVSVTGGSAQCAATAVTLTASGAVSYSWSPSTALSATTGSSVVATATTAGANTYTVTGTDGNGCTNTASTTITVTAAPSAPTLSSSSATVCTGGSVSLNSYITSGGTYEWYTAPQVSASYLVSSPTAVSAAGTYYVFAKNNGCYSTGYATFTLSVNNVSAPSVAATAISYCAPATADLTALQPAAATGTSLEWHTVSSGPSSGNKVASPSSVSGGTYYLYAYSSAGNCYGTASSPVTVTINAVTNASVSSTSGSVCSPATIDLTSYNNTSGTNNTYSWYSSNSPVAANLVAIPSQVSQSGTYYLYVTNAAGCQGNASAGVTLAINSTPTASISSPASVCSGIASSISATTNASSPSYVWQLSTDEGSNWSTITNTGVYSGATSGTLAISNTTGLGGSFYRYTVTGSNSCSATSSSAILVEDASPSISTQPADVTVAPGTATSFSVTIGNSPTANYQWQVSTNGGTSFTDLSDNSTYSGTAGAVLIISNPTTTLNGYKYRVNVSNTCTTVTSTAALLTVSTCTPPTPSFTASPASAVCLNTNVTYTTQSSESSYVWSVPGTLNTDYSISSGGTGSSSNTVTLKWLTSGSKTVTVNYTSGGCAGTTAASNTVTVNALPSVSVSPTAVAITTGSGTTLTASGADTYSWSPSTGLSATTGASVTASPTSNSTYTVTGTTTSTGCTNTTTAVITVNSALSGGGIGSDQTICTGSTPASLTSTSDASGGTGTISYQWQQSTDNSTFTNISGATAATYSPSSLTQTTYYKRLAQTSSDAAVSSGVVTVTVQSSVGGSIAGSATVCAGTNSTVLTLSGHTGSVTKWQSATTSDFSGTVTDISNTTTSYTAANLSATTYYRAVVQQGSCTTANSGVGTITVNALPTISVSPASPSITTGSSVSLTASGANSYSWSPSTTLSSASGATVTANPTNTATYTVTGTNTTTNCSNTATVTVTVNSALTAGAIAADQTICSGTTPSALTSTTAASGGTGTISYQWQQSTDNSTYTDIVGATGTTYAPGSLTQKMYYRRGAYTSVDAIIYTSPVTVTVQSSVGGSIAGGATVCAGTNSTVLTLSGHTGSIVKWQSATTSNFSGTVNDITNTATTYTAANLSTTTYYRAVVQQGSCTTANSGVGTITVNALPTISVSPASSSITTGSSVSLTASGADSYSWSPSTTLSSASGATVTANPTNTTTYTVTGTNTTTNCSNTATVTVTVAGSLTAGAIAADQTICSGTTPSALTSTADASGGTGTINYQWQQSTDNSTYTDIVGETGTTYAPGSLTQTTYYRRSAKTSVDAAVYTSPVTITVQSSVGGSIAGSATVCAGTNSTTLTLSGHTGSIVRWQSATTSNFSGTVNDITNTATTYTAANLSATTYYRAVVQQGSCTAANSGVGTITVNALPTVSVSPASPSITTGSSVSLTASGANSYSWSPSTALSSASGATVTANPTSTATYTVTGTNTTTNCSNTATVTVTVNGALTAGAIAADQTICSGSIPAALTSTTAASGGTGAISYQWQQSTDNITYTDIVGETSATYAPGPLTQKMYYKRGAYTSVDAIIYTSPVIITVQSSVGGSIAGSATVCAGTNSTVLTLSGNTGSVIKWQSATTSNFSGTVNDIANTATTYTAANLNATTYYRAVVQQGSCTAANSGVGTVTVNALPTISVSPASPSITTGSSVSLTASGANSYSWSPSTTLSSASGATVTANPTSTATYTVTGTNTTINCSNTATVTVTVNSALTAGAIAADQTICNGTTPSALTSTTAASDGTGTINYQWQQSTDNITYTDIVGETGATYAPGSLTQKMYYKRGAYTSVDAIIYTSPVIITVQSSVGGSITGSATVCAGTNSTVLTLSGYTGSIVKWQSATTSNFSGTVNDITNTSATYTAANLSTTTYYRAVVQQGSCTSANSGVGTITVNALPTVSVSPASPSITTGSSVSFTASGADSYSWSPSTTLSSASGATVTANPTSTATYTVTGLNTTTNCSNTATVTVTVNSALTAGTIAADQTICSGSTPAALTSTTAASGGTGTISYQWQQSTDNSTYTDIVGETGTTYAPGTLIQKMYYKRGAYTSVDAIVYTSPVTVTVQSSVGGSIAGSATVCAGTNSTVLTLSGHTGSIIKWQSATTSNFSGTINDIANTSTTYTAATLSTTTYYRAVVQQGSCTAANSGVGTITVNALPTISVSPASPSITTGSSVSLTASGADSYSWSPSTALSSASGATVTANPTNTTTYTVTGTITSTSCANTATVTVTVNSALTAGAIAANQTICSGTTPSALTSTTAASGGTGTINYQWQQSTDNSTYTDIVGETNATYAPGSLTQATYYRRSAKTSVDAAVYTSPVAVTVQSSVGGSIAGSATVCAGTNSTVLTLSGNTGSIVKWQLSTTSNFSGTVNDITNTATTYTAANLNATTYYRAVVQQGSCTTANSGVGTITVNALPTVSVSPASPSITTGSSVSLTASGANSYSWSPSTTLSSASGATVTANPTSTATYTVTGLNTTTNCSNTTTVTVTVNSVLTAGAIAADQTICSGSTPAALTSTTAASGGTGTINYQWQQSTDNITYTDIVGETGTTYAPGTLTQKMYYKRGAYTSVDAIVYTSPVTVTVQSSVGGSIAGSATVCAGTNSTVLTLSGHTGSIVKWQSATTSNFSGTVNDITNTATTYTAANLNTTTYYRAVVQQGSCTAANSGVGTITVNALPTISVSPASPSITTGSSVSLTASGANSYSWSPSTTLSSASGATVTANPTSTATYTVTGLSTTTNCSNTATVTVTVNSALTTGAIAADQTICSGTTPSALTSTTAASGGTGTINYQWQQSTDNITYTDIVGETNATYAPGSLTQTTYYRRSAKTSVDAAVYTSPVTITVQSSVGGSIAGSATVCAGTNSTVLTLSGHTGSIVKWQSATTSNFSGTVNDIANIATTYTATNLSATTYYRAVVQQGSCTSANSGVGTITVNALPTINVSPASPSITTGSSVSLTASGANSYSWSPSTTLSSASGATVTANPTSTATYTVTGTNTTTSCVNTATITVTVNSALTAGAIAADQTICSGTTPSALTSTTAASGGTGTISYQWQQSIDNITYTDIVGETGATYAPGSLTQPTYYRRSAKTSIDAAVYTSPVTITVQSSVGGSIAGSTTVCAGTNSTTLTLSGHTGSIVKWQSSTTSNFSGIVNDITNTAATNTAANLNATTYYRAVVQQGSCATANSGVGTITVNARPSISVTPSFASITTGGSVSLAASGANSYSWSPSTTLSSASGATVTANPTSTATYTVTGLNMTTSCSNTATVTVTVNGVLTAGTIAVSQTICSGTAPVAFTSATSASGGTGSISYQWQQSTDNTTFANINGATSATYSPASLTQTTYYRRGAQTGTDAMVYSNAVSVTVQSSTGGTVSGNAVVCGSASSQTFTLSGHTGSVVKWQSSAAADFSGAVTDINNTAASLTVNNVTTTTYYRAVVQQASCTTANSGIAAITVNTLPVITVTPSATAITTGSTTVLTASGANSYSWSPSTGLSATAGASVTANPTTSTTYTVTGTNSTTGCTNTASVLVTINSVLLPGVIAGPQSICSGTAPATLTSTAAASGGTGTISYQWQQSTDSISFTNISGASSAVYAPASLSQTTYYRRVASTTTDAAVYSNTVKITVQNRPLTGTIVGDCSVNKDSTRIYKVAGVANATNYVWTLPAGWSGSSTDSSILVHTGSTNGTISVVPYNGTCAGTGTSYHVSVIDYAKVTIGASPGTVLGDNKSTSLITIQLIDVNGNPIHCSGGAATLCTSSGTFSDVVDHNDGTYTATLKSSANSAVICGTVNGIRISQTVTTQFTGPQGSISANGPIFATETPKLTFNFTDGIGPFTVIYRAGYKMKTDTLFNVTNNSTIPVALIDSTTTYRLVSVIGTDHARRDDHFTRDTATVLIVAPKIVVTLKSDPPKLVKDSVYSTRLSVKVKNIGDVDLNSVQVKANLYDVFPSPVEFALDSVVFNGTTILQNMQYDGRQNFDLFARNNRQPDERLMAYAMASTQTSMSLADVDDAVDHQVSYDHNPMPGYEEQPVNTPYFFATLSKLAVGVEGDIFIYLHIKPNGYKQPFIMQVAAVGTGHTASGAALANSLSNDDENENLHPEVTQKGDPLPTIISILPNPVIGVALSAGTPVQQTDGSFNVPLNYTLKNYGTVNLRSVALYHNLLRSITAPGVFKLVGAVTASDNLYVNPAYDGSLDTNLLSANSMLGINQLATVQFTINIMPNQLSVLYRLQAKATGYSVEAAATVSDLSTDGINPDPDGNNVPDEHLISVIAINRTVPTLVSGTVKSSGPVTYCGPAVSGITIAPVTLTQGGIDPYVYQWQSSADNITYNDILNATDSTYATGAINANVYLRRKVISGNQVAYSNAVFVQIHAVPQANITANGSVVLNINGSVGLSANAAMSYEWSTGETTGNITVKTAGKYWVKITDDNGCWAMSDAIFVQPPPPVTVQATYIQGAFTNPANIGVQVQTSATGATLVYYASASGGVATAVPVLPGTVGSYVYYVSQIVNGQESIRVPVQVNIISPAAVADIQKTLSKPATLQPDGSFLMGFTISAANLRPELLDSVKIKDDLTRTFPSPLKFDVLSVTASGRLIVNNLYNGNTQTDLLADGSQLAGYQRDSIKMMLKVTPYGFAGNLNNIAEQTAKSPYGSFRMLSTDPNDPASSSTVRVPTKFNIPVVDIVIPGGFSPNRDGKNDTYVIIKPFNTRISIEVFNRWGNVVYRSADYNNEWDGKGNQSSLMGNDLPDGTYYYIIIATDKTTGTVRKFNGPLTLKR